MSTSGSDAFGDVEPPSQEVVIGGVTLALKCLEELTPLDGLELSEHIDNTGKCVWPAGRLLAEHLVVRHPDSVKGQTVVEVGAGTGLCGLICRRLGASGVILTDGTLPTVTLCKENAALDVAAEPELCPVSAVCLEWGAPAEGVALVRAHAPAVDVVVASDVLYDDDALGPLLAAVSALESRTFMLGFVRRCSVTTDDVTAAAAAHGFALADTDATISDALKGDLEGTGAAVLVFNRSE